MSNKLLDVLSCLYLVLAVSTCAVGQTQPPAATDQSSQTGSITGKVVNESGQGLPSAMVFAYPAGPGTQPAPNQVANTERDGSFKLSGLLRVPYRLSATMPAYTSPPPDPNSSQQTQYNVGDSVTIVLIKGGVITGRVTTPAGEPVVVIGVRAEMIRDGSGRRPASRSMVREGFTDDRGIYRIYGLPTGTYFVAAGGNNQSQTTFNAFESDVPTYAPSSTRATAAEISVRAGEELSDIDIRHRGEQGRMISGIVSGTGGEESFFMVTLTPAGDAGSEINNSTQQPDSGNREFAFDGLTDGDYYVTAQTYLRGGEMAVSDSKLIKVRGADIAGVELVTQPLGVVSGRVVLDESKVTECTDKSRPVFTEILVSAWHRVLEPAKYRPNFVWSLGAPVRADAQGNVSLRNLAPGDYRFATQFSAKSWYLQSISMTKPPATKPVDAARTWTTIKSGDRLSGLTITLAQGAASLRGQLVLREGETGPEKLFVSLVPAESERAEEVVRYYAAPVAPDGKPAVNNIAPGRYWIVAQPAGEGVQSPAGKLRAPGETETRARLRREAEAAKTEIEFKPCQEVVDYRLRF